MEESEQRILAAADKVRKTTFCKGYNVTSFSKSTKEFLKVNEFGIFLEIKT